MSAKAVAGVVTSRRGSAAAERARFFDSGNAFAIQYPPVPRHAFHAERAQAFAADTPTGLIALDLSGAMELPSPATTPLILARYARIRAGEALATEFRASGEIYHVIRGSGESTGPAEGIAWQPGDTFFLPGSQPWRHAATDDALLWIVTDEPQLAYLGVAPTTERAPGPAHFAAADTARRLEQLHNTPGAEEMPGFAVVFSHEGMEHQRNIHPTMTLALNSLPAGQVQRPHHHNSIAVNLCLDAEGGYSISGGKRLDWEPYLVFVTPPGAVHSHHNEGPDLNRVLIVQDGGIHYHCRTMGFGYDEG